MHELLATVVDAAPSSPLDRILQKDMIVLIGAFTVAIVAIVSSVISSIVQSREREQTRREVAAYMSQGMLTEDQAALLLGKGKRRDRSGGASTT